MFSNPDGDVAGCVFVRPLDASWRPSCPGNGNEGFTLHGFPAPLWSLHSVMLLPEWQGKGFGRALVEGLLWNLRAEHGDEGTVLLDCWAGNEKLRSFWARMGFIFVGELQEEDYKIALFQRPLRNNLQDLE